MRKVEIIFRDYSESINLRLGMDTVRVEEGFLKVCIGGCESETWYSMRKIWYVHFYKETQ